MDNNAQLIAILDVLTDVPFNIWLYLLLILPPVLLYLIHKNKSPWMHIVFVLASILIGYVLINLSLHTHRSIIWRAYELCQSKFPDGLIQQHAECGEVNIADGASTIFNLVFGWLPAAAYIGVWQLGYRLLYRSKVNTVRYPLYARCIVNLPVFAFYFCLLIPLLVLLRVAVQ